MLVMMALMMTQLGTGTAYLGLVTGHVDCAFLGLFSGLAVATTVIAVIAGAPLADADAESGHGHEAAHPVFGVRNRPRLRVSARERT